MTATGARVLAGEWILSAEKETEAGQTEEETPVGNVGHLYRHRGRVRPSRSTGTDVHRRRISTLEDSSVSGWIDTGQNPLAGTTDVRLLLHVLLIPASKFALPALSALQITSPTPRCFSAASSTKPPYSQSSSTVSLAPPARPSSLLLGQEVSGTVRAAHRRNHPYAPPRRKSRTMSQQKRASCPRRLRRIGHRLRRAPAHHPPPPAIKTEPPLVVKPEPLTVKTEPEPVLEISPKVEVKEEVKPPPHRPAVLDEKPDVQMRPVSPPRGPRERHEKPDVQMRPPSPPRGPREQDEKSDVQMRPPSPPRGPRERDEKPDVQMRPPSPPRGPRERDEKPDAQMRNASPPRHPRNRGGGPPTRGAMYQRRSSRSPPRGPRGDRERFPPRGGRGRRGLPSQAASFSSAGPGPGPSTYPSASTYSTGPGPSTYPASASAGAPPTPTTPVVAELPPPRTLAPAPEPEVPLSKLPPIPAWDVRDPEHTELAASQKASKAQRAALRAQYLTLEKANRRALQELESATLELRAVEGRRKVADTHLEKARWWCAGHRVHTATGGPRTRAARSRRRRALACASCPYTCPVSSSWFGRSRLLSYSVVMLLSIMRSVQY
ncbi:hypothetical protein MVEN_02094300 [Mycena venus]|uniref:Uncharacterized protein n=1 Tax=Mycena venus TaxID=2733690 RepID=A0A8H6XDQ8_9AGAR|nr:hypothetical protein MVEN_02094300 [Mycena venus]